MLCWLSLYKWCPWLWGTGIIANLKDKLSSWSKPENWQSIPKVHNSSCPPKPRTPFALLYGRIILTSRQATCGIVCFGQGVLGFWGTGSIVNLWMKCQPSALLRVVDSPSLGFTILPRSCVARCTICIMSSFLYYLIFTEELCCILKQRYTMVYVYCPWSTRACWLSNQMVNIIAITT